MPGLHCQYTDCLKSKPNPKTKKRWKQYLSYRAVSCPSLRAQQAKMRAMSERVATQVDDYGARIEELEQQLAEMVQQAKINDRAP